MVGESCSRSLGNWSVKAVCHVRGLSNLWVSHGFQEKATSQGIVFVLAVDFWSYHFFLGVWEICIKMWECGSCRSHIIPTLRFASLWRCGSEPQRMSRMHTQAAINWPWVGDSWCIPWYPIILRQLRQLSGLLMFVIHPVISLLCHSFNFYILYTYIYMIYVIVPQLDGCFRKFPEWIRRELALGPPSLSKCHQGRRHILRWWPARAFHRCCPATGDRCEKLTAGGTCGTWSYPLEI